MKLTNKAEWLETWAWLAKQSGVPRVLQRLVDEKKRRALKGAKPWRPQLPKEADPKEVKQKLRNECEALCRQIVRARDLDADGWGKCITCPANSNRLQWGHFEPQGDSEWLRYDPRNTAMQCYRCNIHLEGRHFEFGIEIDKRENKPGFAAALKEEAILHRSWRPTITNLEAKRDELKKMVEAL